MLLCSTPNGLTCARSSFVLAVLLALTGCVRDVRIHDADPAETMRMQQRSRLTSSQLSRFTHDAITQLDLGDLAREDRVAAAQRLSMLAEGQPDAPWRLAAAELLLDAAESAYPPDPSLYLSCAREADLELQRALLHEGGLLDSRTDFAADLYRRAVARYVSLSEQPWLRNGKSEYVNGVGGSFVVAAAPPVERQRFGTGLFDRLEPADFLEFEGMRNHHRLNGYGAPMVAIREQHRADPPRSDPFMPPEGLMTAATVTLRFDWDERVVAEVWNPDHTQGVHHHGAFLRLSTDVTAPIATLFARAELVSKGYRGLTRVQDYLERIGIYLHEPYDPTKIPVLMVHGLRSSPATWRDTLNGLRNDPEIRKHYQFWMFYYPTGMPIARSSMYLRRAIAGARVYFDPYEQSEAVDRMVVLGHSMGGLLTKAALQGGGDALWHSLHPEPFDTVEMSPDVRTHLQEVFFYEPVDGIARVVFLGTPHRGSHVASNWLGRLGDWMIDLPDEFDAVDEWFRVERARLKPGREYQLGRGVPSSIDDLRSDSPHLLAYLAAPLPEDLPFHLIVGDRGDGSDGVVPRESAIIDGATSLLVIDSSHQVQEHPLAIREIRRILLLHLESAQDSDSDGPLPGSLGMDLHGQEPLDGLRVGGTMTR